MTKKKTARTRKTKAKPQSRHAAKLGVVNVKMSRTYRKLLHAKAKQFASGNLSGWLRHAGLKYTPKKGEKVSLKAA